jgi:hypothetical protein
MPSPAYFRRQADICVRLSVIASDQALATRLLAMAEDYKAKAGALDTEPDPIQPHMIGQPDFPDGQVDRD